MVDVSRWSASLAWRIEEMSGLAQIVLTHRDDLAEHQRWAQAFASERWIHLGDADAAPSAEQELEGQEPLELAPQMQLLPTPGHIPGSLFLLLGDQQRVLFSGDHVWWNCDQDVLVCSERYCWWDFNVQIRSLQRLQHLDVAWILPGHGHRQQFQPSAWTEAVKQTLTWIQTQQ